MREIHKYADRELGFIDASQFQGVGGHFHGSVRAILVDRLTEEFHQVGGFRRCVTAVKSVLSDPHLDGSRQTGTQARTAVNRFHQIRCSGFSFCPRNACDFQLCRRVAIKIPGNFSQEFAGVRNGNGCSLRTGGDFAFGGNRDGAISNGIRDEPRAVGFCALDGYKKIPFLYGAGVIGYPVDLGRGIPRPFNSGNLCKNCAQKHGCPILLACYLQS